MVEQPAAFARVVVIYPLVDAPRPAELGEGWNAGPWPVAHGAEALTTHDRSRRWHEPTAIRELLKDKNRSWRSGTSLGWEDACVQLHAVELVSLRSEDELAPAYLLAHLSLMYGARGSCGKAMESLANLVRLESDACKSLLPRLGLEGWRLDTSFLRATHLFAVVRPDQLPAPPRVVHDEPAVAWLAAGVDLPAKRENSYAVEPFVPRPVVAGVRGHATPNGVSLAADSTGALRDRDLRGPYSDALLVAVVQRDMLLRTSQSLADLGFGVGRWHPPPVLRQHAEFRSVWWHTAAVDHPAVRVVGDLWRQASRTEDLMAQVSQSVSDIHAEVRTKRSELVAVLSAAVALLALVAAVVGLWV